MYYQVQVSLDSEFKDNIVVNKVVEAITEYRVQDDLEYYTVYYWRVKAIDPLTGANSDWSNVCVFRVIAEDVTISTSACGSYTMYGSNCFGLYHRFVTTCDIECTTPDAIIGIGLCPPISGVAQIGACYCPGVVVSSWTGFDIEYLLTENNEILQTEDGIPIILEY